jgi:hypothetical protein
MALEVTPLPGRDDAAAEQAFVSVLQQTEDYLQQHEAVCSSLKRGWFNIARARHVMGIHQASRVQSVR